MMMVYVIFFLVLACALAVAVLLFYRHQKRLAERAHLMHEAIKNGEYNFRLSTSGLFFGERAMQQTLNELGTTVGEIVGRSEVESWQRLTRILTHEIMNAATPIQSISQAYLNKPETKGSIYEEGIRAIYDTSIGLTTFVDSYRKLTQMQKPQLANVDLNGFMISLKRLYPQLAWTVDIPDGMHVVADEKLLRQVFINILKNAVEANAARIDIRCDGDILISNDGDVIPPEVRRDLFIPFFSTKRNGSGIGLSVSQQILMMQGMNISLDDSPVAAFHTTFRLHVK